MKTKTDQSFIKKAMPVQAIDEHNQRKTIGAILIGQDGYMTVFLEETFKLPSVFRCRREDSAFELRSAYFHHSDASDDEIFLQKFLGSLAASEKYRSESDHNYALLLRTKNRARLLRDALLIVTDWKTRLILQYEYEIVARQADFLEQMIGRAFTKCQRENAA